MVTGAGGPRVKAVGSGTGQARPEQPVGDPPQRGRLQLVPQRAAAQHRVGAQQSLDDGQRTGGVAVVAGVRGRRRGSRGRRCASSMAWRQGSGVPVSATSSSSRRISAGSWSSGASTPSTRPIRCRCSPALHEARLSRPVRDPGGPAGGGDPVRVPRRPADAAGRPRSNRCGSGPGRAAPRSPRRAGPAAREAPPSGGACRDPQRGRPETVRVRDQLQDQPAPGPEPHGDGAGRPPLGPEQNRRLGRPPVDGAAEVRRQPSPVDPASTRRRSSPAGRRPRNGPAAHRSCARPTDGGAGRGGSVGWDGGADGGGLRLAGEPSRIRGDPSHSARLIR